ncbi:MAG TPA: carboxypeptidase regulatory-like domain-containing protein [Planctomycetota bacterium]|nr:carboxypeptidase regulatory-like domain-containing protein [Planctomycetota bacterium]
MTIKMMCAVFATVAVFGLAACGDDSKKAGATAGAEDESDEAEETSSPQKSGPPGGLRGKTTYTGEPKAGVIKMTRDEKCAAQHQGDPTQDWLLVGDGNTLGNVVVWIKSGPKAWKDAATKTAPPSAEVKLDQKGCIYIPHVFALRAGQPFSVVNSDQTDHNVHFMGGGSNKEWNLAQAKGAAPITKPFAEPEAVPAIFKCDIHPWMTAVVGVFGHDAFAVTGKDGAFEFKALPPGDYTLQAYHEKFEKPMSAKVSVESEKTVDVAFKAFKFE